MRKRAAGSDGEVLTVTLRLSREVLVYFQSLGPDWEREIDDALRPIAGLPRRLHPPEDLDPDFVSDGNEG